jgi:site-specific DNA-methyltransferase (adenine-specific)
VSWRVVTGDCLKVMRGMEADSIDAIVTDPPAGISFMGKGWDHDRGGAEHWIAWLSEVMREALRVAKPGAHALVWALPRTSHWTGTAIERAGWEVRDQLHHVFGSGFPKSLDVSKATGAARWSGWGTALKPAHEVWWLARKPLEGTVAWNVLEHGTGGLNVDACRVAGAGESPTEERRATARRTGHAPINGETAAESNAKGRINRRGSVQAWMEPRPSDLLGRWPPNLLLSHPSCNGACVTGCPVAEMDRQSGESASRDGASNGGFREDSPGVVGFLRGSRGMLPPGRGDSGGASRFFPTFHYVAKPSRRERDAGVTRNLHPTVKPLKLLDWLTRLVTPPGGTVLDPFAGSGSTGCAAVRLGFDFIGIEQVGQYTAIAKRRIWAAAPAGLRAFARSSRIRRKRNIARTKGNRMLTFDSMIKEVRDLASLVEPPIGRRITALGVQMATLAMQEPAAARLEPGTTVPAKANRTRHRRRRAKGPENVWVADSKARRVPNWVIKATEGLDTKAKIVDRFGPDARFEVGKALPAALTAAARKAMKHPAPVAVPATTQRQAAA